MMTEEEAKTKWCPHVVASHTNPRQKFDGEFIHNCIASACMMWRENRDDYIEKISTGERTYRKSGFCGLAAKP